MFVNSGRTWRVFCLGYNYIPRINIKFEMCVLLQISFAAILPNIFKIGQQHRVIANIKRVPVTCK